MEWGLKMQEDVLDGRQWMIDQGIADPERICVMGGSYGGYVALVAAYQTPELFQCSISFAGVSDLEKIVKQNARLRVPSYLASRVRKKGTSIQEIRAVSPVDQAARVNTPLLLVHGDVDWRVPYDHATDMVKALNKAEIPHKFVTLENGNHHLSRQSNRLRFMQEIDAWLEKYLL